MMLRVRPATTEDLPALVAYEIEIAEVSFGPEAMTDPAKHAGRLTKGLERDPAGCLVAVDDDGSVRGWLWMAINTNFVTGDRYANFRSLAVTSGDTSTPAARALIDAGLAYARGHDATQVTGKVNAANVPMRVLYAEFGFAPTHLTMAARLDTLPETSTAATIPAVAGPVVKGVVWDLDGTVWDAVAVELPEGTAPTPRADVLDAMRRLSAHGIVNALASRTAPEVAALVAAAGELDALLVAKQIAWQDKSRSLEVIAGELGVAVESLVLVDDTAFERAEVAHALPGVRTMDRDELLARLPDLLPAQPSSDAGQRTARYRTNARRRDAARTYADRLAFLRTCAMRLTVGPAEPHDLPRVLELATRANRLSSTGLALDDGMLRSYAATGQVVVGRLADRFGDDGLVAVALLASPDGVGVGDPTGGITLRVALLSVSCRVAGRGVAEAFVATLAGHAQASGRELLIPIRATGANTELRILLRGMGFTLTESGVGRIEAALAQGGAVIPEWITVEAPFLASGSQRSAPAAPVAPGPPGRGVARTAGLLDLLIGEALALDPIEVAHLPDDTSLLHPPYALSSLAGARLLTRIDAAVGGSLAADDLSLEALTSLGALRAYVARRAR